ncbi:hypothetical protein [Kitasatospora aureofaciens]|uniref:hypothetical protein n=1 Tax=Kitasatospora aureofaciens TaxID=1894 RepID=UPI0033E101D6
MSTQPQTATSRRALDALIDWLIAEDEAETEATGGCPACDTQHDEMCVACGSCRCDTHERCVRPTQEA